MFLFLRPKIYLLNENQRVKVVVRGDPNEVAEFKDHFAEFLSNITGAIINVDSIRTHMDSSGKPDTRKYVIVHIRYIKKVISIIHKGLPCLNPVSDRSTGTWGISHKVYRCVKPLSSNNQLQLYRDPLHVTPCFCSVYTRRVEVNSIFDSLIRFWFHCQVSTKIMISS